MVQPIRFTVSAGTHDRVSCPVSFAVPRERLSPDLPIAVYPVSENGRLATGIPAQGETAGTSTRVHFVLPGLAAGQTQNFELRGGADVIAVLGACTIVQFEEHPGRRIDVVLKEHRVTSYCHAPHQVRPYLYPLMSPSHRPLTRELEGDRSAGFDHPHHRSCYCAHGDVNGSDVWSEEKEHGRVVHREFVSLIEGPVFAGIAALNDWVDHAGRKLLEQVTTLRFYNTSAPSTVNRQPSTVRVIDKEIAFRMTEGEVRFGDTKEGGLLSIRVHPTMTGRAGGRMTNSHGASGEAEVWGLRADWLDYSGPVQGGEWAGIAMFDTPGNFRYPTYWHARDYGLATANPFGLKDFLRSSDVDGSHTFPAGSEVVLRYRLLLHEGGCEEARIAERYHDYVSPPSVTTKL